MRGMDGNAGAENERGNAGNLGVNAKNVGNRGDDGENQVSCLKTAMKKNNVKKIPLLNFVNVIEQVFPIGIATK